MQLSEYAVAQAKVNFTYTSSLYFDQAEMGDDRATIAASLAESGTGVLRFAASCVALASGHLRRKGYFAISYEVCSKPWHANPYHCARSRRGSCRDHAGCTPGEVLVLV